MYKPARHLGLLESDHLKKNVFKGTMPSQQMGDSVGMPGNQMYITFHYKGSESHPELSVCATG